jgi:hypothetical protein
VSDGCPITVPSDVQVGARPRLRVYQLPGCAPELNPTESIWSSLKRGMANLAAGTVDDLYRITRNRLKRMQYRLTFADGFLAETGLAPP